MVCVQCFDVSFWKKLLLRVDVGWLAVGVGVVVAKPRDLVGALRCAHTFVLGRLGFLFFVDLLASSEGRCSCGVWAPRGLREGGRTGGPDPEGGRALFSKEGRSPESEAR